MAKAAQQEESKQLRFSDNWLTLPRILFWVLVLLGTSFQARLWLGEGSLAEVWQLKKEIGHQQQNNYQLSERNRRLAAEVKDLKEGLSAVEERARAQLGMVKEDETFYLIIDK
ncbi:MAG: cell division protein FtsB [Ketobacteraceae bacterium]|nr:cell division protein FtsB [Ketobacteraceae bacterium]